MDCGAGTSRGWDAAGIWPVKTGTESGEGSIGPVTIGAEPAVLQQGATGTPHGGAPQGALHGALQGEHGDGQLRSRENQG